MACCADSEAQDLSTIAIVVDRAPVLVWIGTKSPIAASQFYVLSWNKQTNKQTNELVAPKWRSGIIVSCIVDVNSCNHRIIFVNINSYFLIAIFTIMVNYFIVH